MVSAQPLSVLSTDNTTADLGVTASGSSLATGMSGDGRYVVFASDAKDVIPGQASQFQQLFLFDQATAGKTMITHSVGDPTVGANGHSESGRLSRNGRWVVFVSQATDVIAGQVDPGSPDRDVFLWDRVTGVTTLVSHVPGSGVTAGDDQSFNPAISADGRFIAYDSSAGDLVAGQTGSGGTFLYDRLSDTNVVASHALAAPAVVRDGGLAGLSDDGAYVYFASSANDLVAGYSGAGDFFLFERASGNVTLVTHAASDLVAGQVKANATFFRDVFLFDRTTGANRLVDRIPASPVTTGNTFSQSPLVSDNGTVVFQSNSSDLVSDDLNNAPDVFSNSTILFSDGFEAGDTGAWSMSLP